MSDLIFVGNYKIPGVDNYGTIEECADFLRTLSVISIDIETSRKYPVGKFEEKVYKGGLDPYLSNVVMLQIGNLERQYVIDVRKFSKDDLLPILTIINYNKDITLVGHNLKFEAKHLKHNYGINFHTIWDTMIAELCLYNGIVEGIGLADLAERYLGVKKKTALSLFTDKKKRTVTLDDELLNADTEDEFTITPFELEANFELDKSTRLQFVNIGDKPFTAEQVLYGKDDIVFPYHIREIQMVGRKLSDGRLHRPKNWWKNEFAYTLVLADMELNGMPIDVKQWEELHDKNYEIYLRREKQISEWVIENYPEVSLATADLFSGEKKCAIQWTSQKQVVSLYKYWNICPRAYSKQTKQTEYTVGATELIRTLPNNLKVNYEKDKDVEINDFNTFTLQYLLFKTSQQAVTTFGKKWLKNVHPITGRVHSNYRQILNTTRISSTNPNLNNISGGAWRDCFKVNDGNIMVNLDFANQEVRQLAAVSEDEALQNFFIKGDDFYGDDFHSYTATKVYKILENNPDLVVPPKEIKDENGKIIDNPNFTSDDKSRRSNSKDVTFGMAFGKSAITFALDLGVSVEEAEFLVDSYLNAFPGLKEHFKRCEERSKVQDYIIIDEFTGAAWFCPFFNEIQTLRERANSYFPPEYWKLKPWQRKEMNEKIYKENPEIRALRQQAGRLASSYQNKHKNYIIQGACSQMLKIAMNILRKTYIEKGYTDLKLIGNIYDEVLVECDEINGDKYGKLLKESMERGGKIISPKVPQIANYVLGKVWAH